MVKEEIKNLPTGTHFWTILNNQLVMCVRLTKGVFVCGDWEGNVEHVLDTIVSVVTPPEINKNLYYNY